MSHNIWARAYSRSCSNLHFGFIYVVKCGSSWGVEGCGADGQLIDQTASHLLIYSDRKSISSFFFLWSLHLSAHTAPPSRARLWSLLSFTPLYKWMPGQHVYCWRVLNCPYVIFCSVCALRLIFIASVCLQHVDRFFSLLETEVFLYLGKQAFLFNLLHFLKWVNLRLRLPQRKKNVTLSELYIYFCINSNCSDCLTNGFKCCWRCPGYWEFDLKVCCGDFMPERLQWCNNYCRKCNKWCCFLCCALL